MEILETYHNCDLCGEKITGYSSAGSAIVESAWANSVFQKSPDHPIHDICKPCCAILQTAKNLGIVTFDLEPFLIAAGWEKDEKGYSRTNPLLGVTTTIYNDR